MRLYLIIRKFTLPSPERFQVLARVVHMDFVREHLATKKGVDLKSSQVQPNLIELTILADTIYIKVLHTLEEFAVLCYRIGHGNVAIDCPKPEVVPQPIAKCFTVANTLSGRFYD